MIVMKFGGTSVEDARAIDRTASIVQGRDGKRPVVVVSAMAKVTDTLLTMAQAAGAGDRETAIGLSRGLRERHYNTAGELLGTGVVHALPRGTGSGVRCAGRAAARDCGGWRTDSAHHRSRRRLRRIALQQDVSAKHLRREASTRRWWTRGIASLPTRPICGRFPCSMTRMNGSS